MTGSKMVGEEFSRWSRLIGILTVTAVMLITGGCGVSQTAPDSASIIKSFHDAVNTKNVDAAMALVADDAVFSNIQPSGATFTGKAQIKTYVQSMVDLNIQIEPTNLRASGDKVTYDGKVTHYGTQTATRQIEVGLQGGRIKSFTDK